MVDLGKKVLNTFFRNQFLAHPNCFSKHCGATSAFFFLEAYQREKERRKSGGGGSRFCGVPFLSVLGYFLFFPEGVIFKFTHLGDFYCC